MIRPIVKDILFLQQKAEKAGWQDAAVGRDLLDTLAAHIDTCVGMAANMIGSTKAIIAVREENHLLLMYNPKSSCTPLPVTKQRKDASASLAAASAGAMTISQSAMKMKISIRRKSSSKASRQKSCSTK